MVSPYCLATDTEKNYSVLNKSGGLTCAKDSDCKLVNLQCSGYCQSAINKEYRDEYLKQRKAICSDYSGRYKDGICHKQVPKCIAQICQAVKVTKQLPNVEAPK